MEKIAQIVSVSNAGLAGVNIIMTAAEESCVDQFGVHTIACATRTVFYIIRNQFPPHTTMPSVIIEPLSYIVLEGATKTVIIMWWWMLNGWNNEHSDRFKRS